MKILCRSIVFILLFSCSSWKQKDFVKDLDAPVEEVNLDTATSTKSDVKLLDKFKVQSNEPQKNESSKVIVKKADNSKPVPKKTTLAKVETIAPVVKSLPADYPPEMVAINTQAKKVWDLYRPNHKIDEKIYLDIHYLGMTVGKIMVLNKGKKMINNQEVWHLHARFKSAPFYSSIYELDDSVDSFATTDQFLSTKFSLVQRESKQSIDDLQLHDRDQLKTFWFYHQKKSDGTIRDKKLEGSIPFFSIDPFSVLFLFQGLPLKNGDNYEIPIVNKGKILILKSLVEGREKIETEKGKKSAIRVHATTKYTGDTLKSGDLYFWFSDDDRKTLLKAQAKIKIGSVTADIVEN